MKYIAGNIAILYNEKTVYIMDVNEKTKKYIVFNVDDSNEIFEIKEKDIMMKV